jgi:hypothetical protein
MTHKTSCAGHDRVFAFASAGLWSNVLDYLRDTVMDLDKKSRKGCTLLTMAVKGHLGDECLHAVVNLLQAGADVNAYDHLGTPLHHACMASAPHKIETLLQWGADPTLKTCDGRSVLQLCAAGMDDSLALMCMQRLLPALLARCPDKWEGAANDIRTCLAYGRPDLADLIATALHWSPLRARWIQACV